MCLSYRLLKQLIDGLFLTYIGRLFQTVAHLFEKKFLLMSVFEFFGMIFSGQFEVRVTCDGLENRVNQFDTGVTV